LKELDAFGKNPKDFELMDAKSFIAQLNGKPNSSVIGAFNQAVRSEMALATQLGNQLYKEYLDECRQSGTKVDPDYGKKITDQVAKMIRGNRVNPSRLMKLRRRSQVGPEQNSSNA
jgi:hypothetical protein